MFRSNRCPAIVAVIASLLLAALAAPSAGAGVLYAIGPFDTTFVNPANLYTVDPTTSQLHDVGQTHVYGPNGIAFDKTGALYAFTTMYLYSINPTNGVSHNLGAIEGNAFLEGDMVADPASGLFYASDSGGFDSLYTIDPRSRLATPVGIFGDAGRDISGLAFVGRTLYGLALNDNQLDTFVRIDTTTGRATTIGRTGTNSPTGLGGMAWDPETGVLYMTDGSNLYTVDVATGHATPLTTDGSFTNVSGLSVATPVPLPTAFPAAAVTLALGAACWATRRPRQSVAA